MVVYMSSMIRLHGGPGDGLHLAITAGSGSTPPEWIVYDPDSLTVQDATAGQVDGATYRRTGREGIDWEYRHEE